MSWSQGADLAAPHGGRTGFARVAVQHNLGSRRARSSSDPSPKGNPPPVAADGFQDAGGMRGEPALALFASNPPSSSPRRVNRESTAGNAKDASRRSRAWPDGGRA